MPTDNLLLLAAASVLLGACGDAGGPQALVCADPDCTELHLPFGTAHRLQLDTYERSGEVVHPDVVLGPFGEHSHWLTITPYPGGNATYENPSIFQSRNGVFWRVPPDAPAPLARPSTGYFSDPDAVLDPVSGELRVYFRQVARGQNILLLLRSPDGASWDDPAELLAVPSHRLVSPAVIRRGTGDWELWSVNSGAAGCAATTSTVERRRSADGLQWGEAESLPLAQPGQVIWHLDVQWIAARNEYWAVYNTYRPGGTCVTPALYFARSPDGSQWTTYPGPVLQRGELDAFPDVVYRATFAFDPAEEAVTFWYSGARYNGGYEWAAATQRYRWADLLDRIATPRAHDALEIERDLPPPEPHDMPATVDPD